jgi:cellulose synthase/poly-beta-1,6-N-acetylglucosamine synthase-like glycosyltransferase
MLDERSLQAAELKRPLVSIIVTNYNYEKYIIPCLRSVARQSYPQYQCVVVDDASEDASVTLIEEFIRSGESRQRISLVRHERKASSLSLLMPMTFFSTTSLSPMSGSIWSPCRSPSPVQIITRSMKTTKSSRAAFPVGLRRT